jgi:multicomponent Na+:H+ antiporter subunit F
MHSFMLSIATIWIAGLLGVIVIHVISTRSALTRILALDLSALILIALLAVSIHQTGSAYALDAALTLALLSFVGTVAAARYHSRGSLFR